MGKSGLLTLLACHASLIGCASDTQKQARERGLAAVGRPVLTAYILQPGDVVSVKFFYHEELNEKLPVRPDGFISLQLVGDVRAAGLTVPELRQALIDEYTGVIREAEVAVLVNHFDTQKAYVGGEVVSPGMIPLSPYTTALQAVIMAGGPLPSSEFASVVVIRDQGTDTPDILLLNLNSALYDMDGNGDIALHPHDIVWVPQSEIAKVNQFVQQYIEGVLPISRSFLLNYNFGSVDSDIKSTGSNVGSLGTSP